MKGIVYIRVSSEEQVKGTSLEFQEEICRKYCSEKGIEIPKDGVFREEGASAKTADRVQFLRAVEFCRKHKGVIEAFVVAKSIASPATPKTISIFAKFSLVTA